MGDGNLEEQSSEECQEIGQHGGGFIVWRFGADLLGQESYNGDCHPSRCLCQDICGAAVSLGRSRDCSASRVSGETSQGQNTEAVEAALAAIHGVEGSSETAERLTKKIFRTARSYWHAHPLLGGWVLPMLLGKRAAKRATGAREVVAIAVDADREVATYKER